MFSGTYATLTSVSYMSVLIEGAYNLKIYCLFKEKHVNIPITRTHAHTPTFSPHKQTPTATHKQLNAPTRYPLVTCMFRSLELSTLENKGPEFFGFSHPTIQNLIQSCPGARKCSSYEWQKFEVTKDSPDKHTPATDDDPLVNFDALQKFISSQQGRSAGGSVITFLHVISDMDIK